MSESVHPSLLRLRTVCRCNNIKHATIARVIDQGAVTITEVARLTTATTGQCGGSCTPRVLEMLEQHCGALSKTVSSETADEEDAWWVRKC